MALATRSSSTSYRKSYVALTPPPRAHFPGGAALEEVVHDKSNGNRSYIRKFTVLPESLVARSISQLPCLRRVIWRRRSRTHEYNVRAIVNPYQRDAVLIQTRGQQVYSDIDMCTRCQSGLGPFSTCVVARASNGEYPSSGACGNCIWRGLACKCSFRDTFNGDSEEEWQHESEDEDEDEDDEDYHEENEEQESYLQSPPPSPDSKTTAIRRITKAASKKPPRPLSKSNSRIKSKNRPQQAEPRATSRAKGHSSVAVVIPSPPKSTGKGIGKGIGKKTKPAGQKYFKIPAGLSPNTAEDIRHAIDELNAIRTKLCARLELLECVHLAGWE
ncbi:conserved hypothetical protein [Histoplasma capsulatum var. duboisii H88]|uniref:DUF3716 superfamily domain-containing protein n=2 Tax=Ajellomyces capsulatus TaxID=5037 RepID=F0U6P2_AJEC8|nr:conserved hypothetical protein [Histoplasma capsulatum H143]EGC40681.1 conserved hypothetical protein [Histoplasma capsulatum var. duboisii H88]QSS52884.1 DUF3716 superfamily domain-containing protein [Histoplasma capsulatum var. duboisii H88]